jgi:uncharacterized protein involved in outer membrane biogenesis
MRRWLRLGLIGVAGLLLLAVVAVAALAVTFDPNTQKARIIEAVRRATGRELVLAGPLKLSLGWVPTLEAEDAALANRPGGSRPQMATVGRLQASVALLPLLSRRVEIETVTLDRPDILLETDAQGIGNWQFQRPVAAAGPSQGGGARTAVALHRLVVENGRVTWRNGVTGRATTVDVPSASLTLDGGTARLVADAQTAGQMLHLDGVAVTDGAGPWPLKLTVDAAGGHAVLDGRVALPLSERSFSGRITASTPDLQAVAGLLQLRHVPPLHDVQLSMMVDGADMMPHDVTLHAGATDLGEFLPGATLAQLDLAMPALGQPGRLGAAGTVEGGAWQVTAGVVPNRQSIALRGLTVTAPGGDVAGDVALVHDGRWALRGSLVSQRLDADWLRALKWPATAPAPAAPQAALAPSPPLGPRRVFSDAPLPWDRLRLADADLQFTVGTLHAGRADYRNVAGHLSLLDGALRLDPLAVQAPEGVIDASLALDAGQPEPLVRLALRSAAFALDPLLQAIGLPGGSHAPVELDVVLASHGSSPHALALHLDGHAGVAMVDGDFANAALAAVLGDVVPAAAGRLDPAGRSAVRCMAVRLDAQAGQVTVAALQLDTSRLALSGSGAIDLANETLDLRLRPTVRLGATGVTAPVRVSGPLSHPIVAMDPGGVEGRAGIVIGGPAPADDCAAALTLARDGRPGPLPATVAMKAPKAADILRSFLR